MSKKATKWKAVCAVIMVSGLQLIFGPGLLYLLQAKGIEIYSVSRASQYPGKILLQWGILSIYPAMLVLAAWKGRKKDFLQDMYLKIREKKQKIFVIVLGAVLLVMSIAAIVKTGDFLLIVLNLLYYLVVVAFAEEFILRGVCPFLLKDFRKFLIYLLPNILFAGLHIFAYNGFQMLSMEYVIHFLSSQMLGLVVSGLVFQLLKDYTGTLWIPILLHAVLDFSSVFA